MSIKEKIYKNGVTLIYRKLKRRHTSVATGFVFGKNREKYSESIAHFCEHMFFKETEKYNEKQLSDKLLDVFTMYNAHTDFYLTWIDFCRSNKVIEPCFELTSEMLLNTKYSKKCVENEKGVIKQELLAKLSNAKRINGFARARTLSTDYLPNESVLGTAKEIDSVTPKSLRKFRDEVFISQNFFIAIEGGISYFKAKKLAEKYFINKLKSNPNYPVDKTNISTYDKAGNLNIEYFPFNKSMCSIIVKLDKDLENIKTNATLRMLAKVCNGLSGKILKQLRDKGLVYSAKLVSNEIKNHYCIRMDWECASDNVNKCIEQIGLVFKDLRVNKIDNEILKKKKENVKLLKDESIQASIFPNELYLEYLDWGKEAFNKKTIKQFNKFFETLTQDDIQTFCQQVLSKPENIFVTILTGEKEPKFYDYETIVNILTKE